MVHAPHGRLGTVGILGNHDYGFGWRMPEVAEEVSKIVRAAGAPCSATKRWTSQGCSSLDSTTCGGRDSIRGPARAERTRGFHGGALSQP